MITTIKQFKKINEKKESAKQKFISDKIRTLMDEGREHKQAVAIAISMWEQKQKKKKSKNETFSYDDEITITKELAVDIIINHMQYNKLFKNFVGRELNQDIESNNHLKTLLSELDNTKIEKLLLKI